MGQLQPCIWHPDPWTGTHSRRLACSVGVCACTVPRGEHAIFVTRDRNYCKQTKQAESQAQTILERFLHPKEASKLLQSEVTAPESWTWLDLQTNTQTERVLDVMWALQPVDASVGFCAVTHSPVSRLSSRILPLPSSPNIGMRAEVLNKPTSQAPRLVHI